MKLRSADAYGKSQELFLQEEVRQKQERKMGLEDTGTSALLSLGFTKDQAERALKITQGNVERAANWLLQ